MLPTASGRWILVYEGANTVSEQTFHSLQCLFLWRQLCRSARLSVYSEEGARCDSRIHARRKVVVSMLPAGWVAPFALPIPNLPDASSDELGWLFLVCKQPLHLDKHERLMRVACCRSRPCDIRPVHAVCMRQ